MNQLIAIIDEIARYGLEPNVDLISKEKHLEQNLVFLYAKYFELKDIHDPGDYPDFDRSIPDLNQNIVSNFPQFGWYDVVLDINKVGSENNIGTGDAVDDLHDIIIDILEVRWRLQHNSVANALWFFCFIMDAHTKAHILCLLRFLHERKG